MKLTHLTFLLLTSCAGSNATVEKSAASSAPTKPTAMAEKVPTPSEPTKPVAVAEKTSAPSEPAKSAAAKEAAVTSLHSFRTQTLEGQPADLSTYKGKVVLVVNVASQCGFTPQYKGLEQLYEERKDKGFVVLGFPSNDFGGQEPGSAEEIRTFCTSKYDVKFPLFSKVVTKSGADQSPLYAYLGKETGQLPGWNFCKYLVGKDGKPIAFYASKTKPDDKELGAAIDKALAAP